MLLFIQGSRKSIIDKYLNKGEHHFRGDKFNVNGCVLCFTVRSVQPLEGSLNVLVVEKRIMEEAAKLILVLTEEHAHFVPIISKSPVPKENFEIEVNV
jgi:hypothetical protein